MNTPFLKARQTKYVAFTAVYILVILAVITVANVLADRYNKSYDFTSNKRYSLSDQTAKIVKDLKQDATITYFDQTRGFSAAKDQLDLYSNLSPKVHVRYVDPDKEPRVARAAGYRGPGSFTIIQVGDKQEDAKSVTEEEISGAFIRALKNTTRTVCFATGSGEHQIDDSSGNGFSRLKDLIAKERYVAKSVNLLQNAEVPSDCTVLVIAGPSGDYVQPEVDAIKKYVEGGGRAMFLLGPPLKMGRSEVADNEALAKTLQSWGVTLDKDLILDLNPIGQVVGVGPEVALVSSYDTHPIVRDLKGSATGFPISRSIEIKNGDKTTVEKLFSSSDSSLATQKLDSPAIDPRDPKNRKGPLTMGAAGTYNTGKENVQGRFVVIGSAAWAANSFLPFNGNRDLALNAMNWLSSDEDLISIRPKAPEDRRVTLTAAQMNWVRLTSQFILPLLVVFAGVSVWWRRR
jgi:ABC-type uncharacterized transport system involved in gliding motility auxiliary subunit